MASLSFALPGSRARLALKFAAVGATGLVVNPITLLVLWAARFVFADGWIWRATSAVRSSEVSPSAGGPHLISVGPGQSSAYHYDIAGVLRIESDVRLRELFHFL